MALDVYREIPSVLISTALGLRPRAVLISTFPVYRLKPCVNLYIGIGYIFGTHVMCEGYSSLSVTTQCLCIPETNDTHGFLLVCWILTREVLKNLSH